MPTKAELDRAWSIIDQDMPRFARMARSVCRCAGMEHMTEDAVSAVRIALVPVALKYDPAINDKFYNAAWLRAKGAVVDFLRGIGGRRTRVAPKVVTARDLQVKNLLLHSELDLAGIARKLGLELSTVKNCSARVYASEGVKGRMGLLRKHLAAK